jgi:hypothetical protein
MKMHRVTWRWWLWVLYLDLSRTMHIPVRCFGGCRRWVQHDEIVGAYCGPCLTRMIYGMSDAGVKLG